jgi:hypothetical protein
MARRPTRNRMELREQYEAAEAREKEEREEHEDDEHAEADADDDGGKAATGEGEAVAAPVKKKKKAIVAKEPKKRSRTAKVVRQKVVWVVFDNSNKRIQAFPYNQRQDADDLANRLSTEKKSTYFVQPVKEAMEE